MTSGSFEFRVELVGEFAGVPQGLAPIRLGMEFAYQAFYTTVIFGLIAAGLIGIGFNSTSAPSGTIHSDALTNANASSISINRSLMATHSSVRSLGINVLTALENGGASTSGTGPTWNGSGGEAVMKLTARYRA